MAAGRGRHLPGGRDGPRRAGPQESRDEGGQAKRAEWAKESEQRGGAQEGPGGPCRVQPGRPGLEGQEAQGPADGREGAPRDAGGLARHELQPPHGRVRPGGPRREHGRHGSSPGHDQRQEGRRLPHARVPSRGSQGRRHHELRAGVQGLPRAAACVARNFVELQARRRVQVTPGRWRPRQQIWTVVDGGQGSFEGRQETRERTRVFKRESMEVSLPKRDAEREVRRLRAGPGPRWSSGC